jgi:hypothetical protein
MKKAVNFAGVAITFCAAMYAKGYAMNIKGVHPDAEVEQDQHILRVHCPHNNSIAEGLYNAALNNELVLEATPM